MFKIEAFVDDKKLSDVLRALTGLVRGQPSVMPVVNVEEEEQEIHAKSNGSLLSLFAEHLAKHKAPTMTVSEVKTWLEKLGKSALSSNYLMKQAIAAKLVRRTGKSSAVVYHIRKG
jgi:hypothetical protein